MDQAGLKLQKGKARSHDLQVMRSFALMLSVVDVAKVHTASCWPSKGIVTTVHSVTGMELWRWCTDRRCISVQHLSMHLDYKLTSRSSDWTLPPRHAIDLVSVPSQYCHNYKT